MAGMPAQSAQPVISAIANVASYSPGPIAPGEMVIVFGSELGPSRLVNLQLDGQGNVANILSSVQVLFDGAASPLIYVSQNQIAAMVPYGVSGKITTQVQVVYAGVTSDTFQKAVSPTSPGIFSADASGKGQAAINNSDGSLNSSANPATPGSYITFYLTGEGQTDPAGSDGNIATGAANVKATVSVRIAGRLAQLLYAGSAPGNVNGFAQVNVVIPADLQYGGNVPLIVQIGDATSQTEISVAVSGPPAPLPGTPMNITAMLNAANQITIGWTPADGMASRFHIERRVGSTGSFLEISAVACNLIGFLDSSASSGVTYQYRVRAENDYGYSGYSATISIPVPASQPSPPTNVQAVAVSQSQVNLTWNATNTNATAFLIERKLGAAGTYASLATVPSMTTNYPDNSVVTNTAYVYRIRSQGASGFSAYSGEATATTPSVPLPTAPILQGTAVPSSQIHLAWTSKATSIVRFRIERRLATIPYAEINQPGASSTTFDDSGLSTSTTYYYRIRVETGAGLSAYSNEVTVTTLQGLPAAPTNLSASATSSTQVNLAWANNAPDATAIRIESQAPGSVGYTDIGVAASLTSVGITNLQSNTSYRFRVRAQNVVGYSGYSNEVIVTTLPPKTVFLIHGLNQTHLDMKNLALNLGSSYGLSAGRFNVDYGFDFSDCVDINLGLCSSGCTIPGGAQRLAQYIVNANPPGDIVVIGFSLGGLIARDMIVNNRIILNGRKISLVTIGTPNLGYPYLATDSLVFCSEIVSAMDGNWRSQPGSVALSSYLLSLTNQWSSYGFPGNGRIWFAASGRAVTTPTRLGTGCRDQNPYNDGVVCEDSASYNVATTVGTQPNYSWLDPNGIYVHSFSGLTSVILGNTSDKTKYLPLYDPPPTPGGLFSRLTAILNGM
jgi:uncharacterized protein (TIGR03437 family)